jgi:GTP-binding protein
LLLHLVDVSGASGREPDHDFEVILNELASFSAALASKPMVVVATELDAAQDREAIEKVRKLVEAKDMPFLEISAVTGQGIPELVRALADRVGVSRAAATPEPADLPVETWVETDEESTEPEA